MFRSRLSEADAEFLIKEFSESEIKSAVWDCDSSKSPGPDGFNMGFFKHCWNIVRLDLLRVFAEFHSNGKLVKGCNPSYIALIPKKDGASSLNDFRPISLIGSLYKIMAKVLANRLKMVIGKLIGETQSAFLQNRFILDGVVALNEAIEDAKLLKKKRLLFKVDFAKAFDSISWEYLLDIKRKMNFPDVWNRWILNCLSTAKANVLVNGSPSGEFDLQRGVRQGDPLSPFLFLLAAEGFSLLTNRAVQQNLLMPARIGRDNIQLSHLQYADDTMFVVEGLVENVRVIRRLLRIFELISGLAVNFEKCWAFGVNLDRQEIADMVSDFSCQVGSLPIPYLGLKVGGYCGRISDWNDILQKIKKRLQKWNVSTLSMAGRATIIKSVLSSLPLYALSFHPLPKNVHNTIRSLQSSFLWGHQAENRKIHWIKWDDICLPKAEGGLSIRNLQSFNSALLCKWVWRFLSSETSLWKRLIVSRHGVPSWAARGKIAAHQRSKCSGWWRRITNLVEGERGTGFWSQIERKLGDGSSIDFWNDPWSGTASLKSLFPRLFYLSSSQDAKVSDMGIWDNDIWKWNLHWRRTLRCSESSLVDNLLHHISAHSPSAGSTDGWSWKGNANKVYSVKSFFLELERTRRHSSSPSHIATLFNGIWKATAPPKAQILGWRLLRDRLPTLDNLHKRAVITGSDRRCCFCGMDDESSHHLFAECSIISTVWNEVVSWVGVSWAAPYNLRDHFLVFSLLLGGGRHSKNMAGLWICTTWVWWKWRNTILFDQQRWETRRIIEEIKCRFWNWCVSRGEANTSVSFSWWSSTPLNLQWLS